MSIIKKIKSSELVSVSIYSGVSTVIKIFTSFVSAKIIAVYLGPAGLGMLGQLTSFITIFLVLSTGAITNGVIKFVSEFKNEEQEKNHNNAWTIPEGQEPNFLKNPKKWGKEIWFSPMNKNKTELLTQQYKLHLFVHWFVES